MMNFLAGYKDIHDAFVASDKSESFICITYPGNSIPCKHVIYFYVLI